MELTEEQKIIKYENRVTIFIDILGFRKIIKDTENNQNINCAYDVETVNEALLSIRELMNIDRGDHVSKSMQITQFSDCLVISFKGDEKGEVYATLADIQDLIVGLIDEFKIICRGGASYGKLIHTDKVVFGSALVKAYEMESKAAMYPRLIIR